MGNDVMKSFRINKKDNERLEKILDELNKKKPNHQKKITVRTIVYDFINNYCKTEPHGLIMEIKKLEEEIKEKEIIVERTTTEIKALNELLSEKQLQLEAVETIIDSEDYENRLNEAIKDYIKRSKFNEESNLSSAEDLINKVSSSFNVKPEDLKNKIN